MCSLNTRVKERDIHYKQYSYVGMTFQLIRIYQTLVFDFPKVLILLADNALNQQGMPLKHGGAQKHRAIEEISFLTIILLKNLSLYTVLQTMVSQ